jgi:flagellar basal-body rod protein FlgF
MRREFLQAMGRRDLPQIPLVGGPAALPCATKNWQATRKSRPGRRVRRSRSGIAGSCEAPRWPLNCTASAAMDQSLLTAAAGLRARLETLELVGNNIANAATAGFKADREFYNLFLGAEAQAAESDPGWMPVVEGSVTDFRQAVLTPTAAPLDVGLEGPGFFAVEGPQGTLYTRNGNFRRSPDGRLETMDGLAVRGDRGAIHLPPGAVAIGQDGSVSVNQQIVGRLLVAEFPDTRKLVKAGGNYFQAVDGDAGAAAPPAHTTVQQGKLEAANVNAAEAAVRLVEVSRQFEMLSHAVTLVAAQMNQKAIEELPRSGN